MNYKDNLIEKIGGQSQFDFCVIKYCENIQADESVKVFFADLTPSSLLELQQEFLNATLLDLPSHVTEVAMGRLAVNYQYLWQSGLNERHFDVLKGHFMEALRDCWVEEKLISLFDKHFDSLRPLFQDVMSSSNKGIQEQVSIDRRHISVVQRRNRLGGVNGTLRF